jgi:hypothetical protein
VNTAVTPTLLNFAIWSADYVSCSPYRVPIARLAAGQAALQHGGGVDKEAKKKKVKTPGLETED